MPPNPRGGRGRAQGNAVVSQLEAAERQLADVCNDASRWGWSLLRVAPARLDAAVRALQSIAEVSLEQLAPRENLWLAVLQLNAMALRDAPIDADRKLEPLWPQIGTLLSFRGLTLISSGVALWLSAALLRTDTLPALARALTAQRRRLHALCADPSSRSSASAKRSAASSAVQLLKHMASVVAFASPQRYYVMPAGAACMRQQLQALLRSLRASNVVEHAVWLRMELHAAQRQAPGTLSDRDAAEADDRLGATRGLLFPLAEPMSDWQPLASGCLAHRYTDVLFELNEQEQAQLADLARRPGVQLYVGWRLAAHLSAKAGAPVFGLPPSLMHGESSPVAQPYMGAIAGVFFFAHLFPCHQASSAAPPPAAPAAASLAALPYRPVHVVRMLCQALEAASDTAHVGICGKDAADMVLLACYRALLCPMPPAESAEGLHALWPHVVRGLESESFSCLALVASRLLRLPLCVEGQGGGGAAAVPRGEEQAGAQAPLSLRCALEAGLLPAVTQLLCRPPATGLLTMFAAEVCDLLLRQSGAWPALLAFAPAADMVRLIEALSTAATAAFARGGLAASVWQQLLAALLEQTAAVLRGVGFSYGQAQNAVSTGHDGAASARGGSCSGGRASDRGGASSSRRVGGASDGDGASGSSGATSSSRESSGGGASSSSGNGRGASGAGASGDGGTIGDGGASSSSSRRVGGSSGSGASGLRAVRGLAARSCQRLMLNSLVSRDDVDFGDGPAMRAPPDLALIARLGGCPPAGSAAEQRQRKAAITAAALWLPEFLGRPAQDGTGFVRPIQEGAAGRIALHWVQVLVADRLHAQWAAAVAPAAAAAAAAAQAGPAAAQPASNNAAVEPPGASASAAGAATFRMNEVVAMLFCALLAYVERASKGAGEAHPQLSACFDTLEALVVAAPSTAVPVLAFVESMTSVSGNPDGPGVQWYPVAPPEGLLATLAGPRTAALLRQHSRLGLLLALQQLCAAAAKGAELPPGWQPPPELLAEAPHLAPPATGGAPAGWVPLL